MFTQIFTSVAIYRGTVSSEFRSFSWCRLTVTKNNKKKSERFSSPPATLHAISIAKCCTTSRCTWSCWRLYHRALDLTSRLDLSSAWGDFELNVDQSWSPSNIAILLAKIPLVSRHDSWQVELQTPSPSKRFFECSPSYLQYSIFKIGLPTSVTLFTFHCTSDGVLFWRKDVQRGRLQDRFSGRRRPGIFYLSPPSTFENILNGLICQRRINSASTGVHAVKIGS